MQGVIATCLPLVLIALASGCGLESATYTPQDPAKIRAASEFGCDYDGVAANPRPDLSPYTEDVTACGHEARYTCVPSAPYGPYGGQRVCTREPTE
jgi:hypothetical protein